MPSFYSLIIIFICILTIIIILYLMECEDFLPENKIKKYITLKKYKKALYLLDKHRNTLDPLFFYSLKIFALKEEREFSKAYDLSIEALKNIKNPSYELLRNIASLYYNLNLYNRAIDFSKRALKINPIDLPSLCNIGYSYLALKDYLKAIEAFDRVLEFNPSFKKALLGKSFALFYKEDYFLCSKYLEDFILLEKNNAKAFKLLGDSYYFLEEYKKSAKNYEKAISLDENEEAYYFQYAKSLICLEEYDKALDNLNKVLSFSPYNFMAFYHKAQVYSLKKDFDNAFYYLERAFTHCDSLKDLALKDEKLTNLKFFSRFSYLLYNNTKSN